MTPQGHKFHLSLRCLGDLLFRARHAHDAGENAGVWLGPLLNEEISVHQHLLVKIPLHGRWWISLFWDLVIKADPLWVSWCVFILQHLQNLFDSWAWFLQHFCKQSPQIRGSAAYLTWAFLGQYTGNELQDGVHLTHAPAIVPSPFSYWRSKDASCLRTATSWYSNHRVSKKTTDHLGENR